AKPDLVAALCPGRELDLLARLDRRHGEPGAERGLREADRQLDVQLRAAAGELRMLADRDDHEEGARRGPARPRPAPALQRDPVAGVDPRGDLDSQRALLAYPAVAVTLVAGVGDDPALAAAAW